MKIAHNSIMSNHEKTAANTNHQTSLSAVGNATNSKAKWTPGPWAWYETHGSFYVESGALRIAQVDNESNHQGFGQNEAEANASLIAAAPELLEALQLVASLPGFEESEPYAKIVCAAIVKATGAV